MDGDQEWMVMAAEDTLGWETRKQPDWFREKGHLLSDLIEREVVAVRQE